MIVTVMICARLDTVVEAAWELSRRLDTVEAQIAVPAYSELRAAHDERSRLQVLYHKSRIPSACNLPQMSSDPA